MESQVQVMGANMRQRSALYGWLVCGLGALFYCYEYFLRISPSVMTQDLMHVYHIDATLLGNLAAFYYYAYTPMQLPVGLLMDRFGPRRLLIVASLLCAVGTYLFAESGHLFVAQMGRFLVGFGSAFAFVGVLKLATIWLPPNRFAMIAGLTTALGMLGATGGDIALAVLVDRIGWHNTILLSASMGLVLALIILLILPEDDGNTFIPGKTNSGSGRMTANFQQLLTGLGCLLRNPQMWCIGLIGCLLYLPTSAFAELWGIPYLEGVFGLTKTKAATAVSMIFLGWAVGGPLVGFMSDQFGRRKVPLITGALLATGIVLLIMYAPINTVELFILLFLIGVVTSVENLCFAIGREINHDHLAGTALALTNMLVMLGGIVFQPLIGMFLDMSWSGQMANGVRVYSPENYHFAMMVLPIGLIVAAFLGLFVKETYAMAKVDKA